MPSHAERDQTARGAAQASHTAGRPIAIAIAVLAVVARALAKAVVALRRVVSTVGRGAWRQRAQIAAVLTRAGWWAALAAWTTTAAGVLGTGVLDLDRAVVVFATGAAVCAAIVALGHARRMRWLGATLGSLHGISAVVLWFVANA